jgi:hypothetical protein
METFDTQSRIAIVEHEVKSIKEELKEFRIEQKEQYENMVKCIGNVDKRIDILERWRWMMTGGAVVIGYLIAQFGPLSKFIS